VSRVAIDVGILSELVQLHEQPSVEDTVGRVVQFAVQAVGCNYSGVALATRSGRLEVGAVTSPVVADLYQAQIDIGAGPLLCAFTEHDTVVVRDTRAEQRWPQWAADAHGRGVRSVVHVRLPANRPLGVLSLHSTQPDRFDSDDVAVAHILARHTTVAIAAGRHQANLAAAVDARKLIGQAQGILMERFDLDADQAFAVLRRYSQHLNIKLRDIAQQLINTRKLPEARPRHDQ
jgi:GAF domain-containing protein